MSIRYIFLAPPPVCLLLAGCETAVFRLAVCVSVYSFVLPWFRPNQRRGASFPSDPPFPSFVASDGDGDGDEQEIWCPQGEEDPLEIIYED